MSDNQTNKQSSKADHLQPYWFKPGQSGNPNGRPKVKVVSEYVREKLADIDPTTGKKVGELIAERLVTDAIQGKPDARVHILDRTEGKVAQIYQIDKQEIKLTGTLEDMLKVRQLFLDSRGVEGDTPQDDVVDILPQEIVKYEHDE